MNSQPRFGSFLVPDGESAEIGPLNYLMRMVDLSGG